MTTTINVAKKRGRGRLYMYRARVSQFAILQTSSHIDCVHSSSTDRLRSHTPKPTFQKPIFIHSNHSIQKLHEVEQYQNKLLHRI